MSKRISKEADATAPEGNFESRLAELEELVRQLEQGDKPLEESLALYEKGIAALKSCHKILDTAEQRLKRLVQEPGGGVRVEEIKVTAEEDADSEDTGDASDDAPPAKVKKRPSNPDLFNA